MGKVLEEAMSPRNDKGPMAEWLEQLNVGRVMLQRCSTCLRHVFYPRVICPYCKGDTLNWVEACGGASVYSTSTVARREANGGDYNVSLIDLDEGVRMMSRVEGIKPEEVFIGMRLNIDISRNGDESVVIFRPV